MYKHLLTFTNYFTCIPISISNTFKLYFYTHLENKKYISLVFYCYSRDLQKMYFLFQKEQYNVIKTIKNH